MRSFNLYMLSQIRDRGTFSRYENLLSDRREGKKARENEQECIMDLVRALSEYLTSLTDYDGFYYSFEVEHIGKEFDLLKLSADCKKVLNIELKWMPVERERMEKQLIQNRYYLGHLTKCITSFTFVRATGQVYTLDEEGSFTETSIEKVAEAMRDFGASYDEDLEKLFLAKDFLISPVNTPQRFIDREYFLTQQQARFREEILSDMHYSHEASPGTPWYEEGSKGESTEERNKEISVKSRGSDGTDFISIKGMPGTGKTLLLFDLAMEVSRREPVLMIHCGKLSRGHRYLDSHLDRLDIVSSHELGEDESRLSRYHCVFVDEAEQLDRETFVRITRMIRRQNQYGILSCNSTVLYARACKIHGRDTIDQEIKRLCSKTYELSRRIRVNREISSFLRMFTDSRLPADTYRYENVSVIYSNNKHDTKTFRRYYQQKGYTWITLRDSDHVSEVIDKDVAGLRNGSRTELIDTVGLQPESYTLTEAVGQEFKQVLLVLDGRFYYDKKGKLCIRGQSDAYQKLFFQTVTRAREKLCIIIEDNFRMFKHINMLMAQKKKLQ